MTQLVDILLGGLELKKKHKMFEGTGNQIATVDCLLNSIGKLSVYFQ